MSFTLRFTLMLVAAVAATVLLSPLVAMAVTAAGFHFPLPRIFDRTVMAALLIAMVCNLRRFKLSERLAAGFARPSANLPGALAGLGVAGLAIAPLCALAWALQAGDTMMISAAGRRAAASIPAAFLIAAIEEGFFRAFLLDGLAGDWGERGGLAASSAVYALAHVVRSPARFYITGFEPAAGLRNLAAVLNQLVDPRATVPALVGLFLLGLVLGRGFLRTRTVYFSLGLHAGLIMGLKSWPAVAPDRAALPAWLFGFGRFPLVSGAAAWTLAIAILVVLGRPCAAPEAS